MINSTAVLPLPWLIFISRCYRMQMQVVALLIVQYITFELYRMILPVALLANQNLNRWLLINERIFCTPVFCYFSITKCFIDLTHCISDVRHHVGKPCLMQSTLYTLALVTPGTGNPTHKPTANPIAIGSSACTNIDCPAPVGYFLPGICIPPAGNCQRSLCEEKTKRCYRQYYYIHVAFLVLNWKSNA